jgi:alkylation response protein AidB-like acyl-CoA dehydrogenase
MSANPDFDTYQLPDSHRQLRAAVRELADAEIAPYAADVDEQARYPQEAHDALVASDFFAPHIPEEYGGAGADALATCIVIEEVAARARRPRSSRRQQARHHAADPGRQRRGQAEVPPAGRGGRGDLLLRSVRARGRLRHGRRDDDCRRQPDGSWILNGHKAWITNAGVSEYYTVLAVTDPDGPPRRQCHRVRRREPTRASPSVEKERKLGIKGSPTRELYFDNCRIPGDRIVGEVGDGLKIALRTLDHTRRHHRRAGRRHRAGRPRRGRRLRQGAPAVRQADRRLPGHPVHARRHGDGARGGPQLMVYVAAAKSERGDRDLSFFGAAAKCYASDVAMKVTVDAVQLLGGSGYTRDFPVERMMRDAKITQIYEGTNQVQRIVMARQLLVPLAAGPSP